MPTIEQLCIQILETSSLNVEQLSKEIQNKLLSGGVNLKLKNIQNKIDKLIKSNKLYLKNGDIVISYKQSMEDLFEKLRQQFDFLNSSCELYDSGKEHEAARIALSLRVLLHDTTESASLLSLLNVKDKMTFFGTKKPSNNEKHLLCVIRLSSDEEPKFVHFSSSVKIPESCLVPFNFEGWWRQGIIKDNNNNLFTRESLILCIANQDNGGHVGPLLEKAYAELTKMNSIGYKIVSFKDLKNSKSIKPPHEASLRQMGFEMITSLIRKFPELKK